MAAIKTDKLSSNNLMIVLLLINLLVVGGSGLAVKSLYTTIVRDGKVNQKKDAAEKQVKADVVAAPTLVDGYRNLGEKAGVLADALPNEVDYPSLIVTLENMTNGASVKLKNIAAAATGTAAPAAAGATTATTGSEDGTPTPQPFAFTINTSGNYDSLLKLLSEFETSARPMRVTGMQLTGGGNSLSAQIDAQTFYQDKATLPFSTETVK